MVAEDAYIKVSATSEPKVLSAFGSPSVLAEAVEQLRTYVLEDPEETLQQRDTEDDKPKSSRSMKIYKPIQRPLSSKTKSHKLHKLGV